MNIVPSKLDIPKDLLTKSGIYMAPSLNQSYDRTIDTGKIIQKLETLNTPEIETLGMANPSPILIHHIHQRAAKKLTENKYVGMQGSFSGKDLLFLALLIQEQASNRNIDEKPKKRKPTKSSTPKSRKKKRTTSPSKDIEEE
ncbi:MAG: hypothetical protein EZS28_026817 [Streblomastix strix]|uniref:Uncharacterized protein n=1 Tax=Streblomastix strix TaxID=222440 RepID=A0A5J4V4J2_9EUKA|nr:MAG: hypothetical protein EZS28_026817 [Streblomastix strix]